MVLQSETVLTGLDVMQEAGGPWRSVVKEFTGVAAGDSPLRIEFRPRAEQGPGAILSGIEVLAE